MNDIRDNLKSFVSDKYYNQAELARRINLTPSQFCSVLHKKRKLDANELYAICSVLGISTDDLKKHKKERN